MAQFTHLDRHGRPAMVDVTEKDPTLREAAACGMVRMKPSTVRAIGGRKIAKGDVLAVARIAGIMAAKKTGEIIPLCHPLELTGIDIEFRTDTKRGEIAIEARVRIVGRTGVEMEAMTAVGAAALTIYDMCKSVDREMVISDIMLLEKSGGRSGTFRRRK